MGSLCCCFGVPDVDDHGDGNPSICQCLNCCIQNWMNKYGALFGRGSELAVPPCNQGAVSSDSAGLVHDNSSATTSGFLVNNPNTRVSPVQQDVVVRRQDKGSSHSSVEPEPLQAADVQVMPKLLGVEEKVNAQFDKGSKQCRSESSMKFLPSELEAGVGYAVFSSEDEDVCPTCLEEYTPENPRIVTQCLHHYHLSCIYEWKERSDSCPVCGKLMAFEETL